MDIPLALMALVYSWLFFSYGSLLPRDIFLPSVTHLDWETMSTMPTGRQDLQLLRRNEAGCHLQGDFWAWPGRIQCCLQLNLCQQLARKQTTQSSCPMIPGAENYLRTWGGDVT